MEKEIRLTGVNVTTLFSAKCDAVGLDKAKCVAQGLDGAANLSSEIVGADSRRKPNVLIIITA